MKNGKKFLALPIVAALVIGTLSGCGKTEAPKTTVSTEQKEETTTPANTEIVPEEKTSSIPEEGLTIRLGGCDFAIWNPQVNVALHEGLFEKEFEGENVTFETYNFASGPAGNEAFAAGELDIFNGMGDQPFITGTANNVPIVLLGTTGEQGKGNLIVVKEDSGINEAKDIAGKKIGLFIGTQQHKAWLQYLEGNGVDVDSVEIVNLQSFQELYSALNKGDIDAFYTSEYNFDTIKEEGVKTIDNLEKYPSRCYFTAREEFVEEHPDVVERIFKVLYEAQEFIDNNPEKAYEYLAEDSGLSVEEVAKTVSSYKLSIDLNEDIIKGIHDTYDFLINQGTLETEIKDLDSHINASFVK